MLTQSVPTGGNTPDHDVHLNQGECTAQPQPVCTPAREPMHAGRMEQPVSGPGVLVGVSAVKEIASTGSSWVKKGSHREDQRMSAQALWFFTSPLCRDVRRAWHQWYGTDSQRLWIRYDSTLAERESNST